MAGGIEFFVLFAKLFGVRALVANPALVNDWRVRLGGGRVGWARGAGLAGLGEGLVGHGELSALAWMPAKSSVLRRDCELPLHDCDNNSAQ